jgi:hypothetical protein
MYPYIKSLNKLQSYTLVLYALAVVHNVYANTQWHVYALGTLQQACFKLCCTLVT